MRSRKILGTRFLIQLSVRPFIKRSRQVIAHLEEPFYNTGNPMAYAILCGIILGCLIFMMLSGKSLFGALL
ncbi:hypothetical protein BH10BAC2_BH10BAC2_04530 [soil metagenome]